MLRVGCCPQKHDIWLKQITILDIKDLPCSQSHRNWEGHANTLQKTGGDW